MKLQSSLSAKLFADPDLYRPMGHFRLFLELGFRKLNVPIKGGHVSSHSADCNWSWLLPPNGPSPADVSTVERRGDSNPGSLPEVPTELRNGPNCVPLLAAVIVSIFA